MYIQFCRKRVSFYERNPPAKEFFFIRVSREVRQPRIKVSRYTTVAQIPDYGARIVNRVRTRRALKNKTKKSIIECCVWTFMSVYFVSKYFLKKTHESSLQEILLNTMDKYLQKKNLSFCSIECCQRQYYYYYYFVYSYFLWLVRLIEIKFRVSVE